MHFTCAKCLETSTQKEDLLECSTCKKVLHFYCTGYSEQNYKKMSNNTKSRFTCSECQTTKSPKPQTSGVELSLMSSMEKNIEELTKSVSFMSSKFDDFSNKIDYLVSELKNIKIVNEKIITENKRLSDEVEVLKYKIDEIEQHNLGITVEITGIPKTTNENCVLIVEEIGKKTNTELKVLEANRINFFNSKQNIILAKLDTLDMRKNLIRNVKSMKLTTDKIYNKWPVEKVFVNERLTKSKRALFAQTRSAAKDKQYKFVWLSNADILVRKDEKSKITKIKSSQDIQNL